MFLPGESQGRGSLVGCRPWDRWGLDMTERLHFYFSLSCSGEGNGNPLQCSCLENPRDGGAWWAAVYGVAQSQKRLKWPGSSSSILLFKSTFILSSSVILGIILWGRLSFLLLVIFTNKENKQETLEKLSKLRKPGNGAAKIIPKISASKSDSLTKCTILCFKVQLMRKSCLFFFFFKIYKTK